MFSLGSVTRGRNPPISCFWRGMKGTSLAAIILGAKQGKGFKTAFSMASRWERGGLWLSGSGGLAVPHANFQLSVAINQLHVFGFPIQLSLLCCWLPLIHPFLISRHLLTISYLHLFFHSLCLCGFMIFFSLSFQWDFMRAEIKHIFKPLYVIMSTHSSTLWNVLCHYHTIESILSKITKWIPWC